MKEIKLNRNGLDGNKLYIGTAREIRSLYKNIEKRDIAIPVFSEDPKFNELKNYGLYINYNFSDPTIMVWSASHILGVLFDLY